MTKIHPNWPGLQAALRTSEARRAVDDLAEQIAASVRASATRVEGIPGDIEMPVRVDSYETDRARATVWLAHPSGLADQAKNGSLTKAASAAGLEVHSG